MALKKKTYKEYCKICKQRDKHEKQINKQVQRCVETIFSFFNFYQKEFIVCLRYSEVPYKRNVYYHIANKPNYDWPGTVTYGDKLKLNNYDYSERFPIEFLFMTSGQIKKYLQKEKSK